MLEEESGAARPIGSLVAPNSARRGRCGWRHREIADRRIDTVSRYRRRVRSNRSQSPSATATRAAKNWRRAPRPLTSPTTHPRRVDRELEQFGSWNTGRCGSAEAGALGAGWSVAEGLGDRSRALPDRRPWARCLHRRQRWSALALRTATRRLATRVSGRGSGDGLGWTGTSGRYQTERCHRAPYRTAAGTSPRRRRTAALPYQP